MATAVTLGSVNLMNPPTCFIEFGGLDLGDFNPGSSERQIKINLFIQGATMAASLDTARLIETQLWQAQRAVGIGATWIGSPVALTVTLLDSTTPVYFDVKGGTLLLTAEDFGPSPGRRYVLTLATLPWARGAPVVGTTSGTLTNGGNGVFITNVTGDLPALCQATLVDTGPAGALPTPTGLAVTTSTAGGTLAATTAFYYRVSATGGGGETLACAEVSVTTGAGATNSNSLNWNLQPGVSGWKVYGRTTGAELLIASLPPSAGSFIDTGTVTPAGALPGSNTSKAVVNRVHMGVRSAPGMASTDFTPVQRTTAAVPTTYALYFGGATGGTYTLTFGANTTAAISYLAQAQAVQAAFTALASVGAGNATVTGSGIAGDPLIITFAGTLAAAVQGAVTWTSSLTGATSPTLTRTSPTNFTDTTALGGATPRMTPDGTFRSLATVTQPVTGAYQAGVFDIFALARTANAPIGVATGVTAVGSGSLGTIAVGSYTVQVVELDASANLGAPSLSAFATVATGQNLVVNWTISGKPTTQRIYYLTPAGAWAYVTDATGTATSVTITGSGGTGGNPPGGPSALTALPQLLPLTALSAPVPSYVAGRAVSLVLGNSTWELVNLGTLTLPPVSRTEALSLPAWQLLVQVSSTHSNPAATDIAGVVLLPHHETQLHTEVSGLQLWTQRTWIADTRRDLRAGVTLTDGSAVVQGQAAVKGRFLLPIGGCQVAVFTEAVGGSVDTTNQTYTLQLTYVPRFRIPRGTT